MSQPRRICYFGTYRDEYPRNQIMIEGLRRNGIQVIECHAKLWHSFQDRHQVALHGWWRPRFLARLMRAYLKLIWKFIHLPEFDVLVVGYPGQLDVFLAKFLCVWTRKPLVWDIFMSIYLISSERKIIRKGMIKERLMYLLEWAACRLPDKLIIDTEDYSQWFQHTYGLPEDDFRLVPTGADDRMFHPPATEDQAKPDKFRVIYHGTFIPNHGVMKIIEAARYLKDEQDIEIVLIGDGPERAEAMDYAQTHQMEHVTFIDWLQKTDLVAALDTADLVLGAFGDSPQSLMTIQNKIYEGLALRKPILSSISPAISRVFTHGQDIYLCDRNTPSSISDSIRYLKAHPEQRGRIGENGYHLFKTRYNIEQIGRKFAEHVEEIVGNRLP